jgi:Zn-dependent protease
MTEMLSELVVAVLASIIAITLHEAAHGYAALWLGDPTAKLMGRLSLNPLRHVDLFGTLLVPGFLVVSQLLTTGRVDVMFGWAKPVPVDFRRLRDPRTGMMLVAAAGPVTNFCLAFIAALLAHPVAAAGSFLSAESMALVYGLLGLFMLVNLVLGLFNLIPIPPLDGGRIVTGLLPYRAAMIYARIERYGLLLVLGVLFLLPKAVPGFQPMSYFLRWVVSPTYVFMLRAAGIGSP